MKPVLETKFAYKGYPCVVLFMPEAYRCGYVGVPYSHKLAKKRVVDLGYLNCHGGVTYAEPSLYDCNDDNTWWIGFNCAHCFDGYDVDAAKQYFGDAQTLKDFFIQWNTSGESLSASKRISKSVHLLMSKMSARNLLTRLKRSDTGWAIKSFVRLRLSKQVIRKGF